MNKHVALRIYDPSRRSILLRQHINGTWAIPSDYVEPYVDPMACLGDILGTLVVSADWKLVAASEILRAVEVDSHGKNVLCIVYDIEYTGRVLDVERQDLLTVFKDAIWCDNIEKDRVYNVPTRALISEMRKSMW